MEFLRQFDITFIFQITGYVYAAVIFETTGKSLGFSFIMIECMLSHVDMGKKDLCDEMEVLPTLLLQAYRRNSTN